MLNTLMPSSSLTHFPHRRLRRLRENPALRSLVQETHLLPSDFVAPVFIVEGTKRRESIGSMPGIYRYSIDALIEEVSYLHQLGIQAVNLFPSISPQQKDKEGSAALRKDALCIQAIGELKAALPQVCVIADIALDPFTDHGHDGLIDQEGNVLNDQTLEVLTELVLRYAEAGVDIVAPSDMMDGRVGVFRRALDSNQFSHVSILSHAAKYTSAFYGPYRDVLQSLPRLGDKKGYQLNPANSREALLECAQDEAEGADILMIKPALFYLDIIAKLREQTMLPVAAFHVSGEYSMILAASEKGWMDKDRALEESLMAIKRAGADMIVTWAARWMAERFHHRA